MKNLTGWMKMMTATLLIALMLAPTAGAEARYGVITTRTSNGSVHLRARAGTSQAILGYALNGDAVEILQQGNTWHRVRLMKNGRIGWVYGKYLRPLEPDLSGTASGAQLIGSVAQVMTKYPTSTVNLRQGAGTNYGIIGKFGRGTRLEILEELGNWHHVRVAGTDIEGWMSQNYISQGLEARTTGRVNLRRGAGTGYAVIRTLKNMQDVTVTWVGEDWSRVEVDGESGYISNSYYVFR